MCAAAADRGNWQISTSKEPDNEDDARYCRAVAHIVTGNTDDRPRANQQGCSEDAGTRNSRRPRSRGTALERGLYDRPRSERMRRADVDIRQQRRTRTIRKCFLTCSSGIRDILARRRLIGKARKNRVLRMADAAADENSGARRIAGLECLYDVVASVRGALRKLRTHACDCATELDLQRNPRQHLDERGISGLLGDILVKLPLAHGKCFRISALQRDHDPNEDILKSPDVVVAHLRDGEFDRETFKQLE